MGRESVWEIVTGYTDGSEKFGWEDNILREQMAVILPEKIMEPDLIHREMQHEQSVRLLFRDFWRNMTNN